MPERSYCGWTGRQAGSSSRCPCRRSSCVSVPPTSTVHDRAVARERDRASRPATRPAGSTSVAELVGQALERRCRRGRSCRSRSGRRDVALERERLAVRRPGREAARRRARLGHPADAGAVGVHHVDLADRVAGPCGSRRRSACRPATTPGRRRCRSRGRPGAPSPPVARHHEERALAARRRSACRPATRTGARRRAACPSAAACRCRRRSSRRCARSRRGRSRTRSSCRPATTPARPGRRARRASTGRPCPSVSRRCVLAVGVRRRRSRSRRP